MATNAKKPKEIDDWDSSPKKVSLDGGEDDWAENGSKARVKKMQASLDQEAAKNQEQADQFISDVKSLPSRRPRNLSDLRAMSEAVPVSVADAVFLGHLPQVAGGITSLVKGTPYVDERDQSAKDIAEIKSRAPFTFGATNLAANLAAPKFIPKGVTKFMGNMVPQKIADYMARSPVTRATLQGAAQGAAYNPGDNEGEVDPIQLSKRLKQAAGGAAFSGGSQAASSLAVNAGDRLMQKAVGRGIKYTPGVGEELANQGVWGTRGQMRDQVNRKLKETVDKTTALTSNHPNLISSQPIADEVLELNRRKLLPSGRPNSSLDIPDMQRVQDYVDEINQRGMQSAADIHKGRVNAGTRVSDTSWENPNPAEQLKARMSKSEQIGSSKLLKKEIPEIIPLDKSYEALAKARKPLNREGGGGGNVRIPTTSGIVSSIPGSAIGLSTLGQIGVKTGHGMQKLTPALLNSLLEQFMTRPHYDDEGQGK